MSIGITFLILSFMYLGMTSIIYFRKERQNNIENKIYSFMVISAFINVINEFLCIITVSHPNWNSLLTLIINKIFLINLGGWIILFSYYIYSVAFGDHKCIKNAVLIFFMLTSIAYIIAPIEFFFDGTYTYSFGAGANIEIAAVAVQIASWVIIATLKRKSIGYRKLIPLVCFIVGVVLNVVIRSYAPGINIFVASEVFITIMMYFTIENPDMKMLEEVSAARDQADKANRAKSDFLSSMSHEIRTPLNAIVGLSEDIASYIDQVPPEVVEDTKDIQNASQTLLEIVGNILDISKIESNRMEIVNAPYNLKEEVEGLCRVTSTRIGDKPIDYTLTIADDVPYELIGDKGKVKEIVNNLFTNSIKYTEKGKINLSIKCVNDFNNMYSTIYITCQDTGRGIKAESISRLFDKFDRLDVERNTTAEGTGLGLAITKKMIEMMGGKINVSSQFGVGSIFMVAIPQKISKIAKPEGEDELSDTAKLANSNFDLGKRRILIVDDNNLNIKVATKALKDFNFELDSCNSGQECLDKFKAGEHYDLILMDIMMPVMSGETTLHTLQQSPAFTTPVIALTADAVAGAQEKYISAGFVDYIAKPFSRDQIKGKLEKIFIKGNE